MVNIGPHNNEAERRSLLTKVLEAMPAAQPPRGNRPNWGTASNRSLAYYLAACWGHSFSEACTNCDADVWDVLLDKQKALTP